MITLSIFGAWLFLNFLLVVVLLRRAADRERREQIARRLAPDNVVQLRPSQIYRGPRAADFRN